MSLGLRIGEILERTGVTRATVHHYVKEGLLPTPLKTGRSTALYDPGCVERILLIRGLQSQYRRSLSEVKELLSTHDSAGMVRLLKLADLGKVLENPFDQIGQSDSLTEEQLMDRTGFRAKQLDALEELGLIRSRRVDEQKVFASGDVQVAVCVSRLSAAGLNRRHGFQFADAVIYVDSLRKLLQTEVELFLAKAEASGEEEDLLGLAAHAIEEVTPLVVALRAKLLREVLESR